MASSAVIVDDLEQFRAFGDLRHAPAAAVRSTLAEVVRGTVRGRLSDDEVVIF